MAWRSAVGLLAALALALVVSLVGCGPSSSSEAASTSPAGAAARAEPTEVAATGSAPTATPVPTPQVRVEEIDRAPPSTACVPGLQRASWQFRDFVKWTPDGASVLFTDGPRIYAVAADGSRLWQVVEPTFPGGHWVGTMAAFAISPDGEQIVYATCDYLDPQAEARGEEGTVSERNANYKYELARVHVDGTQHQRLTVNEVFDNHPSWSPDGTRIAFLSGNPVGHLEFLSEGDVVTMAPDGSKLQVVETELREVALHPPQWSPDGERLAVVGYVPDKDPNLAIVVISADGSDSWRESGVASGPSWSPGGERLAFAKSDGAEIGLYTIAADGSGERRLASIEGWRWRGSRTDPRFVWIETVAWSPDGTKILYTCSRAVCVVTLDGTAVGTLPMGLHNGAVPAWSPDGARIAVRSAAELNRGKVDTELYTMAPDGTDVRILVRPDADGAPQAAGARPRGGQVDVAGCSAGTAVAEPATNPGLVHDCEVLLRLRDALAGAAGLDWTAGHLITDWEGVVLGGSPPRVHELVLADRGLSGMIPPEVSGLTELRRLLLHRNHLGNGIPPELGNLSKLSVLVLSFNSLQGAIPPELGQLSQLRELYLNHTGLIGAIPAELGQLTNLTALSLANNHLTEAIPADMGRLTKLEVLYLRHNQLTGSIPSELGQLTSLLEMYLDKNELTGVIPAELGQPANLQELDLGWNQLTGSIPAALGQLTNLRELDLGYNQLTGSIPAAFGQLTNLQDLALNDNSLTGAIPAQLGQLTSLRWLYLGFNRLTGEIPAEFGQLTNLQVARLTANQLTGPIPGQLGQLANLQVLDLSYNQLTGPIPGELSQLANLGGLYLYPNPLTKCIAPAVQKMPHSPAVRELRLPDCG